MFLVDHVRSRRVRSGRPVPVDWGETGAERLAQASGNRALGAHILADMATQAYSLGDAAQTLELASVGLDCGSPLTTARCAVGQGSAHALRGDQHACAQACSIAHRALDRMAPAGEQLWFKVFTPEYLTFEMLAMASDLCRADDVQRLAPGVLTSASAGGALRRQVITTTALAHSYLPSPGNSRADIDQACELLSQVIPFLGSLRSTHSLDHVNGLRRALAAHAGHPSVQEVEDRFHATIAAMGPPH